MSETLRSKCCGADAPEPVGPGIGHPPVRCPDCGQPCVWDTACEVSADVEEADR